MIKLIALITITASITHAAETKINTGEVATAITVQGNTFNGASQLVQMTAAAKLPAVDGSLLTGIPTYLVSTYSGTSPTPNCTYSVMVATVTGTATFGAPDTCTPTEAQRLIIRVKDDGTARTLNFNAIYRAGDIELPTTTVVNKTMYLGFMYNSYAAKWDLIAYVDNF